MAGRIFGYTFENGGYVINPAEAEAVHDYYENLDCYLGNPAAFKEKWKSVINNYLAEVNDDKKDIVQILADTKSIMGKNCSSHSEIIDKETFAKAQEIIKSREEE